jgi:hypothetical protein
MAKTTFHKIFSKELHAELPMLYNFFRKTTKKQNQRIEFGGVFEKSTSNRHGSDTYFVYNTYKPLSKLVKTKFLK